MKYAKKMREIKLTIVAPLVGAWIEILFDNLRFENVDVAPLVGAWIEIPVCNSSATILYVAPLVGAWIEINSSGVAVSMPRSLLL